MDTPTPVRKVNPYFLPNPKGCGQADSCPYKYKPRLMTEADFPKKEGEVALIGFEDKKCQFCDSDIPVYVAESPKPPVPELPKPGKPSRWPWVVGGLLLVVVTLGILAVLGLFWSVTNETPAAPSQSMGTVAGDTCVRDTLYEKVADGKGGYALGKVLEAKSTRCGYPVPPPSPDRATKPEKKRPQARKNGRYLKCVNGQCVEEVWENGVRTRESNSSDPNCNCP